MEEVSVKVDVKTEHFDTPDLIDPKLLTELQKDVSDIAPKEEVKQLFFCNYCRNKYNKLEYLQIHEYIHDPSKSCPVCNITFSMKKDLKKHLNGHIREKIQEDKKLMSFCDFCKRNFADKKALKIHLRVHTNERPYKCKICGKGFKQTGSLKEHNTTHTNIKAFKCKVCPGSFTTASSLKRHMRKIHEAGKTYICKFCKKTFPNFSCLQKHRKECHPDTCKPQPRRCSTCPQTFTSYRKYLKHKEMHDIKSEGIKIEEIPETTSQPKYKCVLCGEKFSYYKKLLQHKYSHLEYTNEDYQKAKERGMFECKLCQREFQNRCGLFKHMSFHTERNHRCDVCQEFFSYYGYSVHKRAAHLIVDCKICKKSFKGKGNLKHHIAAAHPKTKKHLCHICGKGYSFKTVLQMHVRMVHEKSENKPNYQCNFCGKACVTKGTLGSHIARMHPLSARFRCDSCAVSFNTRTDFAYHNITTHSGLPKKKKKYVYNRRRTNRTMTSMTGPKFQCNMCLRCFKNKRNHRNHLQNQVCTKFFEKMQKDFHKCAVCTKTFAFKYSLVAHMVVHSNFYNRCRFCGKKFRRSTIMGAHMAKEHPEEKLYYCGFCDLEFDDLSELRRHRFDPEHLKKIEQERERQENKAFIVKKEEFERDVAVKQEPLD